MAEFEKCIMCTLDWNALGTQNWGNNEDTNVSMSQIHLGRKKQIYSRKKRNIHESFLPLQQYTDVMAAFFLLNQKALHCEALLLEVGHIRHANTLSFSGSHVLQAQSKCQRMLWKKLKHVFPVSFRRFWSPLSVNWLCLLDMLFMLS